MWRDTNGLWPKIAQISAWRAKVVSRAHVKCHRLRIAFRTTRCDLCFGREKAGNVSQALPFRRKIRMALRIEDGETSNSEELCGLKASDPT